MTYSVHRNRTVERLHPRRAGLAMQPVAPTYGPWRVGGALPQCLAANDAFDHRYVPAEAERPGEQASTPLRARRRAEQALGPSSPPNRGLRTTFGDSFSIYLLRLWGDQEHYVL